METADSGPRADAHGYRGYKITLHIATPKGPFSAEFPPSATIVEVIAVVVEEKQLDRKDAFDLVHNGKVLQPADRKLASFGLHGEVKLELVATGSGV
jgi:hypothetical protein